MTTGTGGSRLTGARPAPLVRASDDVETPAQRRALAEQRVRRMIHARRRFVLSLFLLLASLAAWIGVAAIPLHWGVAAVPSGFLLAALVLGRRAAIRARRAENAVEAARRAARQRATQARALANGGPYAPRNRMRVTESDPELVPPAKRGGVLDELLTAPEPERAKVVDESGAPAVEGADTDADAGASPGVGGGAWDPVPVPLPTYVTKPSAPQIAAKAAAARMSEAAKGRSGKDAPAPAAADDASARLAAAMRASAGKPGPKPAGEDLGTEQPASEKPAGRGRAEVPAAGAPSGGSTPGTSSDTVTRPGTHPDEEELMRPAPQVRDETLAQPLEQILARRRAAG